MRKFNTLIVSSDLQTRIELVSALDGAFRCDTAITGQEAVRAFELRASRGERYSLILLDYDADHGEETLIALRQREEALGIDWPQSARFIVFSASEKRIVSAFFRGSEAGHLHPVNAHKLAKQIAALEIEKT